jgi:RNA polymerase sigma-70 factor, ECF subfamily
MGTDKPNPEENLTSSMELLRQAQAGDRAALDQLYARYLPRLSRWASGRLSPGARDLEDTSDVVQEALIRFLDKVDDFTPRHPGALLAYLRTAIMNRMRDASRALARRPDRVGLDLSDNERPIPARDPSPFEQCVARETAERYETALERLSVDERAAVVLKVELDADNAEIAEALGRPSADAARMFVHRAILKLAQEMVALGESPG